MKKGKKPGDSTERGVGGVFCEFADANIMRENGLKMGVFWCGKKTLKKV